MKCIEDEEKLCKCGVALTDHPECVSQNASINMNCSGEPFELNKSYLDGFLEYIKQLYKVNKVPDARWPGLITARLKK